MTIEQVLAVLDRVVAILTLVERLGFKVDAALVERLVAAFAPPRA